MVHASCILSGPCRGTIGPPHRPRSRQRLLPGPVAELKNRSHPAMSRVKERFA
jgi:hypothetical protein